MKSGTRLAVRGSVEPVALTEVRSQGRASTHTGWGGKATELSARKNGRERVAGAALCDRVAVLGSSVQRCPGSEHASICPSAPVFGGRCGAGLLWHLPCWLCGSTPQAHAARSSASAKPWLPEEQRCLLVSSAGCCFRCGHRVLCPSTDFFL